MNFISSSGVVIPHPSTFIPSNYWQHGVHTGTLIVTWYASISQ
jgi:hypothetical protein